MPLGDFPKRQEKIAARGHEADPIGHGIDDDGGQVPGLALDARERLVGVVERQHHHVVEHASRGAARVLDAGRRGKAAPVLGRGAEAHLHVVVRAVVGALELGDLRAARVSARALDRHHHGFASRVREAHPLGRRHALAQERGQLDLFGRGQRERRPLGQAPRGRLHDGGMRVTVDQRRVVVQAVEPAIALDVDDEAAFARRGVGRIRRHVHGRPRVAAGHHALRSREQRGGPGARRGPASGLAKRPR